MESSTKTTFLWFKYLGSSEIANKQPEFKACLINLLPLKLDPLNATNKDPLIILLVSVHTS